MRALARKLAFYILAAVVAITIDFFIPRMMPGNALTAALGKLQNAQVTPALIKSLEIEYGLTGHQSAWDQYVQYWNHLLHGNMGMSTEFSQSVTSVIGGGIFWTLGMVGLATVISFVLGTVLGALVAWRRGSWLDNLLPAMTFFQAAPYFFIAILLIAGFATELHWFPALNGYDQTLVTPGLTGTYLANVIDHAILPALTIVLASAAGWIVGMRNVMVSTMDEDYVLVAQAKGLPKRRVILYAARNAILPSVTGFSLAIGFVVSGALLTEIVFSYPGIGYILQQAVLNHDYPLIQGVFLIITFAVLGANLIADFVYVLLDPRTRQGG
ncbi:MAG TPA: ABC transporter permease [Streptosporangiaceae bacterium]|nr:ABC transporter permease [Streptosporangiaceae bacterium]